MNALKAGLALALVTIAFASAPRDARAQGKSTTVNCKDGTTSKAGRGACSGHGGVTDTVAAKTKSAPATKTKSPPAPVVKTAPPPVVKTAPPPAVAAAPAPTKTTAANKTANAPKATAAPGGGGGKVWVNTGSGVYHMEGDQWYGKTKAGKYMTESDAIKAGYRAEKGNSGKKP